MWIFDFKDYKRFLTDFMASLPKKGRGQSLALANHLNVQQSVITSILKHDRDLTPEQGLATAAFFGFDETTSEYFVLMIQRQRADSSALRAFWQKRLDDIRDKEMSLSNLRKEDREISDSDKAIYYSNWYYSAARIALFLPEYRNVDSLSKFLNLSKGKTAKIIDFFVRTRIVKNENGALIPTEMGTSINDSSEFLNNHRRNWRDRARTKFVEAGPSDYFASIPMSLSKKDAEWFSAEIKVLLDSLFARLKTSPDEVTRCLNIDWFDF